MSELIQALEKLGSNFDQFAEKSHQGMTALHTRLEHLEAANDRPKFGTRQTSEVKEATERFFKTGDKTGLMKFQSGYEEKDMSIGTPSQGGYTLVPELGSEILAAVGQAVPMFNDVRQVTTDSSEYRQILTVTGPAAARSAEGGTRNATAGPRMARVDIPTFDLYAYCPVTNELLDSSSFNVTAYLQAEVERQFAEALEQEILYGSGSTEALGILTQTLSDRSDGASPERSFAEFQFINAGIYSPLSSFDHRGLVTLSQKLPVRYRRGAKFYCSTSAIEVMRNVTAIYGVPVWTDAQGGVSGRPQSILGYEVVEVEAMPDVANGTLPVLFGDLKQAYLFVSHERGLRVVRDDVTQPGVTKFYFSSQNSGKPLDTRALKALRIG